MEEYGKILIIAMPLFAVLIIIEKLYGIYKGEDNVPVMDAVSSISSGITNAVKDVLGLSITFISYDWMVSKIALFTLEPNAVTYIVAFIIIDFYGYWNHRIAHQVNFFWNKHAIHHSSEEFNLACALRQSIATFINLFTFILIPAALIGVPAKVIIITLPIQLFLQFWYHTKHIKKMGFLEKILVTPSHHRVHHAINPEYIDKNHAQIFIIWDKWFGTFQEELASVPPVFGITRPAETWNPIKINFQHLNLLILDAWRSNNWKDKFTIWFKPTGWRPENFEEKYPVNKIINVYDFQKYGTENSKALTYWAITQTVFTLLIVGYLFDSIGSISLTNTLIYGFFILTTIYSYTELMDKNKNAIYWETIRMILGIAILIYLGGWFGLNTIAPISNYLIITYLLLSWAMSIYFISFEFKVSKPEITNS
ncbi:sterol desaturase/sphingolipid hydroxylase (fatty acid hydroxylase superfamily) [Flavobacterium sp. 7E]|uniref:sterol desaturase family protein n=1 Tax=Flavobacterium sp. 7E TaxID=2735898 RepID=UPI00156FA918|nr:sterol desaturase family protein [Flavobacterium sp. 7E]NRS88339.1 sterol desaturase/sphingolipid hydroxylase (fatty acid hydroxylase superfamily) [Flavobacterium sp. 7E]